MEGFVIVIVVILCLIFLCCIINKFSNEEDTDSVYLNYSRNRINSEENINPESNYDTEIPDISNELPNITLNNLLKENIHNILDNNSFTYVSEIKDKNCIICLDDIEKGEEIRTLRCMHKFHKSCIDKWLERQNFDTLLCPVCDSSIMDLNT